MNLILARYLLGPLEVRDLEKRQAVPGPMRGIQEKERHER
jgi:hypothetical protein